MTRLWIASQWVFWLSFLALPGNAAWHYLWLAVPYGTGLLALAFRWPPEWKRSEFAFLCWPICTCAEVMDGILYSRPHGKPPCATCHGTGTAPKEPTP